jgi:tRNA nucleotidyltransferase (CCA-adding enzyme)
MSGDDYLRGILAGIRHPTGPHGPGEQIRTALFPVLAEWANPKPVAVTLSGSYAKATAVVGGSDVDLFISLKSDTTQTLKQLYTMLGTFMGAKGFNVRRQNVSIKRAVRKLQR